MHQAKHDAAVSDEDRIEPTWTDRLDKHLRPLRGLVNDAWLSLASTPDFGDRYALFLVETYHYVKHSVPLMAQACARLDYRQLPALRYFGRHIAEEAGHDGWLLEDLERLGWAREAVVRRPPMPCTLAMTDSQEQIIEDGRPLVLLGYIYALEGAPWSKHYLELLHRDWGLPRDCLTTLAGHAEADPEHSRDLRDLLNRHITDQALRREISANAQATLDRVARLYNALEDV
jgi:pyrroloquinoline quinone (PQQ) biosynthesis protein C